MVGYELLAETQRDLTAEEAAERLRAAVRPSPAGRRPAGDLIRRRPRRPVSMAATERGGTMRLWGGRFSEENDPRVADFTRSVEIDRGAGRSTTWPARSPTSAAWAGPGS